MAELFLDGCKLYHHLPTLNRWLAGEDIAPIHVEISPTNACNYRCLFCYADHSEHTMGTLPREPYLELMRSMGRMGVKSCLLAGDGEPLLNKACVESIRVGAEAGVDMALNSNGLALKLEISEQALKYLTWLRFSVMSVDADVYARLHGTRPESLEKVAENIAAAVAIKRRDRLDVTLGVQQVLLPENAAEVAETALWAKQLGADYYVLKPFSLHPFNEDYQPEQIEELPERYRTALLEAEQLTDDDFTAIIRWQTFAGSPQRDYDKCLGLGFISQIAADGGVYSCCPFFGQERFLYGNIKENTFEDIWASSRRQDVVRDILDNIDVHNDCMSYCRHHQINRVLWDLTNRPAHVNFI